MSHESNIIFENLKYASHELDCAIKDQRDFAHQPFYFVPRRVIHEIERAIAHCLEGPCMPEEKPPGVNDRTHALIHLDNALGSLKELKARCDAIPEDIRFRFTHAQLLAQATERIKWAMERLDK